MHILSIHSIGECISKKDSLKPDVDDPNFYYRVCKCKYAIRYHLCEMHKIMLKSLLIKDTYEFDFFPDLLDRNFYCRECK